MKKFFETGNAFFLLTVIFLVFSALTDKFAVYFSLGLVFFILGVAVRKKNAQKATEATPKA
jgi:hypothetical protein